MKLQYKITLFFSVVILGVVGLLATIVFQNVTDTIENQMGNNAMDMAVTVASIPIVQEQLASGKDDGSVQAYIESFREKTRFQYIIVMDMRGIQYSYPYLAGVGKIYINGGEQKVLEEGKTYTSADRNVLISAIRAFAPVYYEEKQVGAVLVGLLTDRIQEENTNNRDKLEFWLGISLVVGILVAVGLSSNIKKSIYGLEPKEIAFMLSQRDLILESLYHGIIAVNQSGQILLYNALAKDTFQLPDIAEGQSLQDYSSVLWSVMERVIHSNTAAYNVTLNLSANQRIILSAGVMKAPDGSANGAVVSFEDLTDARAMAEKITGYKEMIQALRAQNHEFLNRLHTISGLVELEEYGAVIDYIDQLSKERSSFSNLLKDRIKNPHLSAILLAKYNKLAEAKIPLIVDKESRLGSIPSSMSEDELCSIVGNLIDNSHEALIGVESPELRVAIESSKEGLTICVRNNGPQISDQIKGRLFEAGVSTKGTNRGMGLHIIKKIVDRSNGCIELIEDDLVTWRIFLPENKVGVKDD